MDGNKFGMVTVLWKTEKYSGTHRLWHCQCECGGTVLATLSDLRSGRRRSCGCLKKTARVTNGANRGGKRIPEYGVWASMKERCSNPKQKQFDRYGGRGIRVCDDWQNFDGFISDMGHRPTPEHTIDRIDNDGNYEPGNCRWALMSDQANNKSTNIFVAIDGVKLSLTQWSRKAGIHHMTVRYRATRYFEGDLAEAIKFYLKRAI